MTAKLDAKVDQYEQLLADALASADPAAQAGTPLAAAADTCLQMASAYLDDGRHFQEQDDPVEALAAFSYGHAWLDAGARIGVLDAPSDGDLFAT
ncbi:MAG: DUF357 domain-containing protein [Halobacteriaceae archaeon]